MSSRFASSSGSLYYYLAFLQLLLVRWYLWRGRWLAVKAPLSVRVECPRYLSPSDQEKGGVCYRFKKSELLCNGHRVLALGRKGIIIVESYTAVWWLHLAGFPNVVAVMGASMSDAQAALLPAHAWPRAPLHTWRQRFG